jgi:hypothetical protein
MTPDSSTPPVTYTPTPDPPPANLFTAGATLSIAAVGDTVPTFSGTVTAPAKLAGVVLPTTLSRSADTPVTWTAGSDEGAWVWALGIDPSSGGIGLVWCRTADDGSYSIPAAAVAMLPSNFTLGLAILWRVNDTAVDAGGYTIQLTAADAAGSDAIPITN